MYTRPCNTTKHVYKNERQNRHNARIMHSDRELSHIVNRGWNAKIHLKEINITFYFGFPYNSIKCLRARVLHICLHFATVMLRLGFAGVCRCLGQSNDILSRAQGLCAITGTGVIYELFQNKIYSFKMAYTNDLCLVIPYYRSRPHWPVRANK